MPVSNPATFSSIKANCGGSNNFKDYYRGGPYVPSTANAGISTTANGLSMSQFSGTNNPPTASVPATASGSASGTTATKTVTSGSIAATADYGNGSYSYSWSIVSYTSCSSPVITSPSAASTKVSASVTCTANAYGDASLTGKVVVKCTVTSNGIAVGSSNVTVSLTNYNTAISCVSVMSFMLDGILAGDVEVGSKLHITDPYGEPYHNIVMGDVLTSESHLVEGVRITLSGGGWLECSTSAPIPTKDSNFVLAQNLLGHLVPTLKKSKIEGDTANFTWERVVKVEPIGDLRVQLIYVKNRCFWASGDGENFILHHNAKPIAPP